MSNSLERYRELGFKEALSRHYYYPDACKDLSFILREAYTQLPKNLQSIVFQDSIYAFRLLPQMQTRGAVTAAHLLLQSAEAALPKQKRNLAVKEFKSAMVAHKRRSKAYEPEQSTIELPHDVLLHIFGFLDMKSLVSAGLVCWSWNVAASNNQLWESQYAILFGNKRDSSKNREDYSDRKGKCKECTSSKANTIIRNDIDWREAFKRNYIGNSSKRLTSNRGYCSECEIIVWLYNMKCCNNDHGIKSGNHQVVPVSTNQVVEYLLNGSSSILSSSDSDTESDEGLVSRLWAYPWRIGKYHVK